MEVHCRVHKSRLLDDSFYFCFFKTHHIILSFTPRFSKWYLPFRYFDHNFVYITYLPHLRSISNPTCWDWRILKLSRIRHLNASNGVDLLWLVKCFSWKNSRYLPTGNYCALWWNGESGGKTPNTFSRLHEILKNISKYIVYSTPNSLPLRLLIVIRIEIWKSKNNPIWMFCLFGSPYKKVEWFCKL
jgi:hypothetical protein